MQEMEERMKAMSAIMTELDILNLSFSFIRRTAKLRACSISDSEYMSTNVIEMTLYLSMNQEGQEGDHTTNSSNTHVALEVEFMVPPRYVRTHGVENRS